MAPASHALKAQQTKADKGTFLRPEAAEVIAAARSLYHDELRPFGRILLKRIRERTAAAEGGCGDVEAVPLIDPRHLKNMCESCTLFRVEQAEGREYSVALIGERGSFVDPCSPLDPYPASMWRDAGIYFSTGAGRHERLPSGRYACAQLLMTQGVPFLQGRSLGEACHIVQLAISQKKILGYAHGQLVAYSQSEECAKEACALRQQPSKTASEMDIPFASWEDLRIGMIEVLRTSSNPSPGMVTLSNVKRLFRSQLNLELCETVLGHSRVWELLQDPRLSDVCHIHGLGNGQAVVQLVQSPMTMAALGAVMPNYMGQVMPAPPSPMMPAALSPGPAMSPSSTCASNRMPVAWSPTPPSTTPAMPPGILGPLSTVPMGTAVQRPGVLVATAAKPQLQTSPAAPAQQWSSFRSEESFFERLLRQEDEDVSRTSASPSRKHHGGDSDCTQSVAADEAGSSSSASGEHFFGFGDRLESRGAAPPPLRLDSDVEDGSKQAMSFGSYCVKNTFVDVSPRLPQRQRRSRSVPKDANLSPFGMPSLLF